MNFFEAIKTCVVEKYCCFKGRARRSEFWYYLLANTLLGWIISIFGMGSIVEAAQRYMVDGDMANYMMACFTSPAMMASAAVGLALLLPSLGVSVRRLHDVGKSGWWVLGFYILCMIPLVNFIACIYFIYLCCKDSEQGENEYGPNPKGIDFDSSNF